jgi:hypothetical protein
MKWISVKDKLPEFDTEVLISKYNDYVTIGELATYGKWRVLNGLGVVESTLYYDLDDGLITHWMPLPNPPQQ